MMLIDFSRLVTDERRDAADLVAAQQTARVAFSQWMTNAIAEATGGAPVVEMLSWGAKEVAARAVLAGTATETEAAMIATEAMIVGETVQDLAKKVVGKADLYVRLIARLAGERRRFEAELEAATTPQMVAEAMACRV